MGGRVMPRPHTGLLVVDLCIYTHTHTHSHCCVSVCHVTVQLFTVHMRQIHTTFQQVLVDTITNRGLCNAPMFF